LLHGGWTALGAAFALLAGLTLRMAARGRLSRLETLTGSVCAATLVVGAGLALVVAASSADWLYTLRAAAARTPREAAYGFALSATALASMLALVSAMVAANLALRSTVGMLLRPARRWGKPPRP
ncbi:MAG: hypothetical protein ACREPI_05020, partial [Candidatus Dormibacterales bacterium]